MNVSKFDVRSSLIGSWCLALAATALSLPASAARPVLKYSSEITLKASPQKSWDTIKTFSAVHQWLPGTEGTKLLVGENGKPLAVREFQLQGGGFVISELLAYDEHRKRFKYRMLKTSLPLANYVAEMWVTPAAHGGSVVHWSATFQRPDEVELPDRDDAATTKLVQEVFKAGLDNLVVVTKH